GMRDALDRLFATNLAVQPSNRDWRITGARTAQCTVELTSTSAVSVVRLAEDISRGQIVASFRVEGARGDGVWRELSRGTTIGYAKLDRVQGTVHRLRVTIDDAVAEPEPITVHAY
ncbi:MAG TPA: hypothetical protein VJS39_00245, partial [Gemmatimonadaceae bacterium]|nr:hypothetical protein [Gemmatimonadaceae bacterium]